MQKMRQIINVILFLFACAIALGTWQVQAQVGSAVNLGLSITPPFLEIIVQPGKNIIQAFNIKNEGGMDLEITPSFVEFTADSDTGSPVVLPNATPFPYAVLQNLDKKLQEPFMLNSGMNDQLVLKLSFPQNHPEKEYYQTLLLKAKPTALLTKDTSHVESQAYIGVNLLIRVTRDNKDQGAIRIKQVHIPKILDVFSPLSFSITAKNEGKTFAKSFGTVSISSLWKKNLIIFTILPENVLADGTRLLHSQEKNPDETNSWLPGKFFYDPPILFGLYTIQVELTNEQGLAQDSIKKQVLAFPISPLLVLTGIWIVRRVLTERMLKVR